MTKYPCLVLDHDDTVVQTLKTLSYPFFCYILEKFRPGIQLSMEEYVMHCFHLGFVDMCREVFHFSDRELSQEHREWTAYINTHIPDAFPGIDRVIDRQLREGGKLFVVSHSESNTIMRDYLHHFGIQPHGIYGAELPRHQQKPNPYPLQDIMDRWGFAPEDILVVDDMKLACQMAQPLGVDVAFSAWGNMGVEALSREMNTLCKYTFDSPEALYQFLFQEV